MLLTACSPTPDVGGAGLERLPVPFATDPEGPRLSTGPDGLTVLSWMEADEVGVTLWYSTLSDDGWQPRQAVVAGRDMFVNWADLPSVVPMGGEHWAAHWLEMAGDLTYSYHVLMSQSFDAGRTWSAPVKLHRDETPTEHGFVSMFPQSGSVAAIWLDGRKTGSEPSGDPTSTGMTLRAARVDRDGALQDEQEIDELICDCCQTDVAVSDTGAVAVYRDRTVDEIRDISVARLADDRWLSDAPLHEDGWRIAGCPVNGPAIAARNNRVAAAWFSMPEGHASVRLKFSGDGGRTFGDAIDVSTDNPVGRADTVILEDGSAVVSWLQPDAGGFATLQLRRIGVRGEPGPIVELARKLPARSSPQLALSGDSVVLAWTEKRDQSARIDSARIAISTLLAE